MPSPNPNTEPPRLDERALTEAARAACSFPKGPCGFCRESTERAITAYNAALPELGDEHIAKWLHDEFASLDSSSPGWGLAWHQMTDDEKAHWRSRATELLIVAQRPSTPEAGDE